jgi:hypothetical protein
MLASIPSSSSASDTAIGLVVESVMSMQQRSKESISLESKCFNAKVDLPVRAGPTNTTSAVSGMPITILPVSCIRSDLIQSTTIRFSRKRSCYAIDNGETSYVS